MRYRCYCCLRYSDLLADNLKKSGVEYETVTFSPTDNWIKFNIWTESLDDEVFLQKIQNIRINKNNLLYFAEYTSSELENAEFLYMYPKKQSINITNSNKSCEYSCVSKIPFGSSFMVKAMHEKQIGLFSVSKEPSMKGKTAFWCENTGFAEVFTDYRVVELTKTHNLKGIEFKNVILKKQDYSEKLFQMTSPNILKQDFIGFGFGEKKILCHICGKEQYAINNIYQLHLDFSKIDLQSDLFITERIFGEGIAHPLYVISRRFYRLLKNNKLDGNLNLSPVVDISNCSLNG